MKKLITLLLVLLMAVVAGCIFGDDDDKKDEKGSGLNATDYLPLVNGATWTYDETTDSTWGGQSTGTGTSTVTGTTTRNGKTYTVIEEDRLGESDSTLVRIESNIVYVVLEIWEETAKRAMKKAEISPATRAAISQDMVEKEIPYFDFNKESWTIYTASSSDENHSSTESWTGKYLGTEKVTVPAGTYENCVKFEITIRSDYSSTYEGSTWSETWTVTTTIWMAPNVGIIKEITVEKVTDENGNLQVQSTETSELKSYSIP